jgi:hypothetical protein
MGFHMGLYMGFHMGFHMGLYMGFHMGFYGWTWKFQKRVQSRDKRGMRGLLLALNVIGVELGNRCCRAAGVFYCSLRLPLEREEVHASVVNTGNCQTGTTARFEKGVQSEIITVVDWN